MGSKDEWGEDEQQRLSLSDSVCMYVHLVTQSRPTLWDPLDCSPPGSWVYGIL